MVAIIDALCERIISYARCRDIFSLYEKFQIMLLVVNLRNQGITRVYSTSSQRLKCMIITYDQEETIHTPDLDVDIEVVPAYKFLLR